MYDVSNEFVINDIFLKYYDQLKSKFPDMNFIIVNEEQKEKVKANVTKYTNGDNWVVLIDENIIKKMAENEDCCDQIENSISTAADGMVQMVNGFANCPNVKGYGMQINYNGTAQYFAVLEKSSAAKKAQNEPKTEAKRDAKKAEAKKTAKEEMKEQFRLVEKIPSFIIKAGSANTLIQKVHDYTYETIKINVRTEEEKKIGQQFDFAV